MKKFADLHCDLLSYWADDLANRTAFDDVVRCSINQLQKGEVAFQALAVYTSTEKGSTHFAKLQFEAFRKLIDTEKNVVAHIKNNADLVKSIENDLVGVAISIENASGFCEEDQTLKQGFENLENLIQIAEKVFYISLTHHKENRFGGGNQTNVGLKNDGKALLEYLSGRKIAIDFAHTSRVLAADILDFTSKNNLQIPILDSHSNFDVIFAHPRNLINETAQEIAHRKGIIGLNFLKDYVGADYTALFAHIKHGLTLNLENNLALGADYFYVEDAKDSPRYPYYFQELFTAECYPFLANELLKNKFDKVLIEKICLKNLESFLAILA